MSAITCLPEAYFPRSEVNTWESHWDKFFHVSRNQWYSCEGKFSHPWLSFTQPMICSTVVPGKKERERERDEMLLGLGGCSGENLRVGEKIPRLAPICAENIESSSEGEGEIFKKFPAREEWMHPSSCVLGGGEACSGVFMWMWWLLAGPHGFECGVAGSRPHRVSGAFPF